MKRLYHYKIFWQKARLTVSLVLLAAVVLMVMAYSLFKADWVNLAFSRADDLRLSVEQALQREENLLDVQLNQVYATAPLFQDMQRVFDSPSLDAYKRARLLASQSSAQLIRSFPETMRSFIRRHGSALRTLSMYGNGGMNQLCFETAGVSYAFQAQDDPAPGGSPQTVIEHEIYDPSSHYESIGVLSAHYDVNALPAVHVLPTGLIMVALVDQDGGVQILEGGKGAEALLNSVLTAKENTGTMGGRLLNQMYYTGFDSARYRFRVIACIDDAALIRANANTVMVLALVVLMISCVFIAVFLSNVRDDVIFIERIFTSIDAMKRGDFGAVERAQARQYRANEFGRIARELDDLALKLKQHILTEYELKLRQQGAEMRALQHQVNPHFLYNTLEVLRASSLVHGDASTAEAIATLGALYRDVTHAQPQYTIRDELALLEKYLRILLFKHGDSFSYQIHVAPEMLSLPTEKFWMQPLAENAYEHGFERSAAEFKLLLVEGTAAGDGFCLEFVDNGDPLSSRELARINEYMRGGEESGSVSIGLRNVYARLRYFYGERFDMRLLNNKEGGVKVRILIPGGMEHVQPADRG